ncbi:UDP-4-amino-4,6-dideoxy-N-acetyl-beta-L-altrosamine N-acetyltransferase [Campylobacter sp. MIT 21-1685]|uniref:UDP-4-amino-4, 6-dideoxy-N-acetyl-beta-L-altrosamine N-acetyltransferase n=1 Tax=unclassified Campylobacter TaxID=2593542 RepID=UPI00224AEC83|nr:MULTISPECIES: UDP-4-amino-4,6-dideoxy-N-acetyl-beta-L-altrosamine N-acetyltransferase [unclassified Campylobacter]MCX2683196.1 UDP-4-amino-4,6-dideoxy-N-acetyl-beta-L-altrosamine N-acetyltransferase [Campylobacter sp. MIT 21-1684]MCX2751484.1 UDP-4-amino-4,6-dideoxy-N-acetyl-beta-L-altrosamine N-acetyltransferase [Campylobacter sp. MIT 21-1682]MCX2807677.1 UDP-4-amino-4,6-dideoxy-N-acetyl-beta-L-altrosamine N-acetyltransferase [Campylobacter sp. MIT 21-1685]
MKIAILTSENQWFVPYAKKLQKLITNARLFYQHKEISGFDIVFILSYHSIVDTRFLQRNKHNIVIHASNLPQGKGWAPLFHQVIEGKNDIVFSLLEADEKADNGAIYLKKTLHLNGLELYEELRDKQANFTIDLCLDFLKNHTSLQAKKQKGKESFYKKRNPKDSQLNIYKSINEQFNLLRTVSNEDFPAFFYKDGKKFILKIYTDGGGGDRVKTLCILLQNFTQLCKEKKEYLRFLRNSPKIKQHLYNQHFISKSEHKIFIQRLKKQNRKVYFCVCCNGMILGSINFQFFDKKSIEFGFYGNVYSNILGIGWIMEQIGIFYAFNVAFAQTLTLELLRENKTVLNLHKKFGFKEKASEDERIIKMELHCKK